MTKNVLITGSSRGIGKAIALRLARDGYDVVLHCRRQRKQADAVAREVVEMGRMTSDVPMEEALRMIPARRTGRLGEVATAVSFRMSEDAAYITRQVLSVNGGLA